MYTVRETIFFHLSNYQIEFKVECLNEIGESRRSSCHYFLIKQKPIKG